MEVCNSPDLFQDNISELFYGFYMVYLYIDDILVITQTNFEDHLKALDRVLQRLAEAVLKEITGKSFFVQT